MYEYVFRHFSRPGCKGFLNDVLITFIDKADPSDLLRRKDYRRRTLKTMGTFGLKVGLSRLRKFLPN